MEQAPVQPPDHQGQQREADREQYGFPEHGGDRMTLIDKHQSEEKREHAEPERLAQAVGWAIFYLPIVQIRAFF